MIAVIDNYDSFVHNLSRYFRLLNRKTRVFRNDETSVEQLKSLQPEAIVISPGPCSPDEAGCSLEVVTQLSGVIPILGVCLGHQAIIQSFGGSIVRAPEPIHGRSTAITHEQSGIFGNVPSPFTVGRYHSLVGKADSIPESLEVTAQTAEGIVMAVQHKSHSTVGLQFHPESILTEHGHKLLRNFIELASASEVKS